MLGLSALKPSFEAMANMPLDDKGTTFAGLINQVYPDLKIRHFHHAGNSSGVVDGAGAVLLASPDYAARHGLKARARVVAMANVGDCRSLVIHPASTTHFRMDDAALAQAGITAGTIRLSIGLEDADELIDDLKRALKAAEKAVA